MEETESSACSVVLDNVRRQAFVRSVNLKAFFKPFDSLNHGEVSLPQFHRVLDIAGIRLTEEEATQVAKVYISPLTGAVKYRQFCCDVDKVFRSSELENDPYLVPLRPGELLHPPPEVHLQPEEALHANRALEQLRLLSNTRCLDLRAAFAPFDKHSGKIPLSVFRRAFPISFRENKFTEEEIHQLARLLTTSDGLVDCRKLYQLVEGPSPEPAPAENFKGSPGLSHGAHNAAIWPPKSSERTLNYPLGNLRATSQGFSTFSGAPNASAGAHDESAGASSPVLHDGEVSVEGGLDDGRAARSAKETKRSWAREKRSVLQKIETGVEANQLPLRESFRDFDGLRKGVCTVQQAQAVLLSVLRLPLGENDWKSLLALFVRSDGMFEYDRLCKMIDSSLGNPEAQQYPTRVVPTRTPVELRHAQEDQTTMTDEEIRRLRIVQDRLAFQVKQTRKILLPTFQDFDKQRTQHVTRRQLWRILGMLGLPVTEEELDLLCLWLCDKGNLQEVAYRPLLAAIDPPVNEEENFSEVVDSVYYRNGRVVPLAETTSRSCKS